MKKVAKRIRRILLTLILGVTITTVNAYAASKLKPNESEAKLPIKISQTDMEVDVAIDSVIENTAGVETPSKVSDPKMSKIEVYRKSVNTTSIAITYKITVTNTGDVTGNADKVYIILPKEPEKFSSDWQSESSLVLKSEDFGEIEPNQSVSKNITISDSTNNLIGTNTVVAMVLSEEDIDQRMVQDQDDEDFKLDETQASTKLKNTNNYDSASMIVSISTGDEWFKLLGLILGVLLLLAIGLRIDKKLLDKMKLEQEKTSE